MNVFSALPSNGLRGIQAGEVYERRLFRPVDILELMKVWRIRPGVVRDGGPHDGAEILHFFERRRDRDSKEAGQ